MAVKLFVAVLFVASVTCEESGSSRTDFFRLPPTQFPTPRVFHGSSDLTSLQQTHILGNFHHRFHPTRIGFPFGANPSQTVFTPQAHGIPSQQQNQRGLQQTPVLRPPGSHQDPQQPGLIAPQEPINNYQNYKGLNAPSNLHIPLGSSQDQSIKNSFPSNAPHTIKFSISSQNYNPNQVKHSLNPGTPPPKLNSRVTPNLVQGRFTSGIQTSQNRPTNNQVPNVNYHQQTSHFNNPPKGEQTSFQNFNIKTKATFNLPPVSSGPDLSTQYNLNGDQSNFNFRAQQSNEISSVSLSNKGPQASEVNHNAGFRPADSQTQAKFPQSSLIQSSVELQHDDLLQQRKFNQHQTIQSNFGFPKISPHQSNLQSTSQPIYEFNPTEQQPKFGQQPVENNFERRTTEAPSTIQNEAFGHQDSIKVSTAVPSAKTISSDTNGRNLVYHKSQDHLQLALHGNFLSNHNSNEISSSPNPIAEETFTTVTTAFEKPKPVVKEITINLNDQGISNDGLSPQLFIKEDRQKEFQEIKSKEQRRRKEKSQEELINEQIQKLLQNHNLEVLRKDGESQRNLQEVQLPAKISEQFKNENYSVQVLGGGGLISEVKQKQKIETTLPPLPELPDHIKKQYEIKLINKDELLKQYDLPKDQDLGNDSSRVFLANGQQLEIVKFSKDGIMDKIPVGTKTILQQPTTTVKPIKAFFEELTKEVIPPGANFELIKHKEDGRVEKVDGFTDGKKVTFVFLEEQPDGSVKIQGVKGNTNQEAEGNEVVDSLIKKIKNGSLKLPPSQKSEGKSLYPNEISRVGSAAERIVATSPKPVTAATVGPKSIQSLPPSAVSYPKENSFNRELTTEYTHSSPYSLNLDAKLSSPLFYQTTPEPPTTFLPTLNYIRPSTRKSLEIKSNFDFLPTVPTDDGVYTPTFGSRRLKPTTSSWFKNGEEARNTQESSTENLFLRQEGSHYGNPEILSHRSSEYAGQRLRVPQDVIAEETNINAFRPLNEVLKENKLNEMAKFLEQSGLTAILNETGPYTIFVPTDKAFKTLETQLGGPEKADDKFRENPRLLSGLLLHHVVPGSFRTEDLQDEMTGVSLAGTQLRVNTYFSDEKRSKDNRVVTINGAKVSEENKNILVPQGLAHSIDRVLFPLPIGDLLQTLKSDREKRFTKFLKSLEYSGLSDMLTGSKTYTVFAPTDKAFSVLTDSELEKLLTKREAAKTIALRHIVPGTLYTAGMNYFQVKDSMETGQKITIKKESGKIKANSAHIISANIPATNGVIHAVETLL